MDNIRKIMRDMDKFESMSQRIFIRTRLEKKPIIKLLNKFITMDKKNIDDEMLDIIKSIIIHSKTIYDLGVHTLPYDDEFYDKILSRYNKFADEPFANNTIGLSKVKYKYETLSGTLDKAHFIFNDSKPDNDDRLSIEEWVESLPGKDFKMLINQKKDGVAICGDFKLNKGKYINSSSVSRGKKDYGEGTDVSPLTEDLKFGKLEKLEKLLGFLPKQIGIQYELMVSDSQKEALEDYLNTSFSNNRSASAGLLRRIIFSTPKERKILNQFRSLVPVGFEIKDKFIDKDISNISWEKIYHEILLIFMFGEISMKYNIVKGNKNEILSQLEELFTNEQKEREIINHDIDGMVLTVLNKSIREKLGRKKGKNKFQIALKFPEQSKKTKIIGIDVTTGKFGYKGILLITEPVILNGTKQDKAQLHSIDIFNSRKHRIGDEIFLKLSGDIIPYGYVDETCKKGNGEILKLPTHCECGASLVETKNKLRCPNENCEFRVVGTLITFLTELNAKGIGPETCTDLYIKLGITKPSELLKLTKKDFKSLDGVKEDSAKIFMDTIKDIRENPRTESVLLSSLAIDSFRASTADKVLSVISLDAIIELADKGKFDKLCNIIKSAKGIKNNADIITAGLISKCSEIKKLLKLMNIEKKTKFTSDKVILVSGIRNDYELEKVAMKNGYMLKESGSKFDVLVIADNSYLGKKKAKVAKEKGKPIMTRNEFMKEFN